MYKVEVVKIREHPDAEYIGRGSPLGNPFVIGKDGNREEVIEKYSDWLEEKLLEFDNPQCEEIKRLQSLLDEQRPLKLGCFCAPKPCHGDIIRSWVLDFG